MSKNPALDQALLMLERVNDLDSYNYLKEALTKYGNEISVEGLKTIGMQFFLIWKNRDNGEQVNNCLEVVTSTINNRGLDIPGAVDENGRVLCASSAPDSEDEDDDDDWEDDEDAWEDDEDDEDDDDDDDDHWDRTVQESVTAKIEHHPQPKPVFREKAPVVSSGKVETKPQPIVSTNGWVFKK